MAFDIKLELDPQQVAALRDVMHSGGRVRRAAREALNAAADESARSVRAAVAAELGVPPAALSKSVKAVHATGDDEFPTAAVRLLNFNLPAIKTGATPQKGEAFPLSKVGDAVTLENTPFRQTMPSGHLGWFERHGPSRVMTRGRYAGKRRQPIVEIFDRSPRKAWESAQGMAEAQTRLMGEVLTARLRDVIASHLDRQAA